jgi:hypothetical protein
MMAAMTTATMMTHSVVRLVVVDATGTTSTGGVPRAAVEVTSRGGRAWLHLYRPPRAPHGLRVTTVALPAGRLSVMAEPFTVSGVWSAPANVPFLPTKCPPSVMPDWVASEEARRA